MQLWSWVYSLFLICFIITIYDFSKSKAINLIKDHAINQKKNIPTITLKLKLRWILLSSLPSSLMLSLTHLITNDLAAIPFLWSTTFAIYLLTFIIAFAGYKKLYQSTISAHIKASFIIILLLILLPKTTYSLSFIPLHLLCFFIISLMCHGHLARIAPHKSYLSQFYVWIALGGMCGGFFITFISPHLFSNEIEYILLVIFSSLLRPSKQFKITLRELYKKDFIKIFFLIIGLLMTFILFQYLLKYKTSFDKETFKKAIQFSIIIFVFFYIIYSLKLHPQTRTILCLSLIILFFTAKIGIFNINNNNNINTIHKDRDFYGTTIITENTSTNLRLLTHGNTVHGRETVNQDQGLQYYGYYKPIIESFRNNLSTKKNIAVIGLGTGILAELNHREKAIIDFFEINPKIVEISQNVKYFSYLSKYKDNIKIHIGDGRILLSKQPNKQYDAIIIDAYNSNSIPTHLLTVEALQIYRTKL